MEKKRLKRQWWLYGTIGALFLGSGLSLISEAGHWKHQEMIWYQWIGGGIIGLALAISGVVFLINAGILKERIRKL
ncbi:hypothetical protein GCM10011344_11790 [Dokdonia pacifica]|uniref:Uncharacterized protein n=1 Tax=Dokdonia pacifica TaxID=1627892 RepID=A0A238YF83_9FLAO|nr:hypothetical protein [Dokdonia pacifica]GGG12719.1 hypothetical protein GCM10011344_11790 [Dokdonia pacifica]SNR69632.1 hypothetical protein SAMN06265376_10214 [Dokdonia pacifica]